MYTMSNNSAATEYAYAKINLGLDIVGKREDGYHLLKMVMQSLELHDTVTVSVGNEGSGIRTVTDSDLVSDDSHNLAYRAAKLLSEKFHIDKGMEIRIEKKIPVAAGLAGGSSDAAAVLRAVNRLFGLGLDNAGLKSLGLSLGADVPYCIEGGTMLSEGIGEMLTPVTPALGSYPVLLIKPDRGVSTKEVYEAYDSIEVKDHPDTERILKAVRTGDVKEMGASFSNVLEKVTIPKVPVIEEIKEFLKDRGAGAVLMSGSGPTVFALSGDEGKLKEISEEGKLRFPECDVILTTTKRKENGTNI
ncbi:MAG: 4-(cytidine 5'-diphospho)-2-C-methyl-D-erythritol kinase [Lachnospiraceae bacterium]|nr:4-(cytidine 5'-diphospho)-2-C-methyl-D-erythritol kinase [Lachnospiraceae bacterium]